MCVYILYNNACICYVFFLNFISVRLGFIHVAFDLKQALILYQIHLHTNESSNLIILHCENHVEDLLCMFFLCIEFTKDKDLVQSTCISCLSSVTCMSSTMCKLQV